jgi:hypothetical protein
MGRAWVVVLEAGCGDGSQVDVERLEALVGRLGDRYPSALYAPDRSVVQFLMEGDEPHTCLQAGVALWRRAAEAVGFQAGELVRAEVKTLAELVAEYEHLEPASSPTSPADHRALASAYAATRRLLRAETPRDAVSAVSALVCQLGGTIVRPQEGDARMLDVDLSLGLGEPMAVAVEPYSVARLCLEEVLPAAIADARRMVRLLGAAPGPEALADLDRP